jgi:UDP-N-acetylglucosamine 2-epimerase (non-hydrolysing)/UDP-GlcNAc3NAcA epimerase
LIKLSSFWTVLEQHFRSVLIDSGQHYDYNMAGVFYSGGKIRRPDMHLGIKGGTPGAQVARIADAMDRALRKLQPDAQITFGDTSTTAGAALAGSYRNVPVAHVEAGLRSFDQSVPEEKNRIVADHLATWRFCPTETAIANLKREGIADGVWGVGDVLYESFCQSRPRRRSREIEASYGISPGEYYLVTCHRAETVDDPERLKKLVAILTSLDRRAIFAVHPRARRNLKRYSLWSALRRNPDLITTPPLDYITILALLRGARAVLTDSGGLQREAYWSHTPCLTLRDKTEWVETAACGANRVVDLDLALVRMALSRPWKIRPIADRYFRMRHASRTIVARLKADLR